jgi:glycosyltransferase involved in cell wall biosynthesis
VTQPRLLAVASARRPCGVADYHAALLAGFGPAAAVTPVDLPDEFAPRSRPVRLLLRRRAVRRLARAADRLDAVLVEYHPRFWNHVGRSGEELFPAFVRAARRPVVAVVHEVADPVREGPPANRLKGWHVRAWERLNPGPPGAALAGCAALFAHAPAVRDWLLALGTPADRVALLPHPVFAPPAGVPPPAEIDRRFALGGRRVVAMVGFPDPRKGFDVAVRAAAGLPADVLLVWAGGVTDRSEAAALARLAAEVGLGDRFRPLGYVNEPTLYGVLGRAAAAVAPFRDAPGSGSVARMIGAGVPVVATDRPSLRELRDAGAGLELVPDAGPGAVRAAVAGLLADPGRAARLAAANREYAGRHGFDRLAAAVLAACGVNHGKRPAAGRPAGGRIR